MQFRSPPPLPSPHHYQSFRRIIFRNYRADYRLAQKYRFDCVHRLTLRVSQNMSVTQSCRSIRVSQLLLGYGYSGLLEQHGGQGMAKSV